MKKAVEAEKEELRREYEAKLASSGNSSHLPEEVPIDEPEDDATGIFT